VLRVNKPNYATHIDTGDFVIVINAERRCSPTQGRQKDALPSERDAPEPQAEAARHLRQRRPVKLIEEAVRGMLPKNTLGKQQGKKLKVYAGAEHPHQAQKPAEIPAAALRA
jgi:large subunit ribosomal protein L13